MPYIPNLIPRRHRVLPDYFKASAPARHERVPLVDALLTVIGFGFFLAAMINILHFFLALIILFTGLLLFPRSAAWLERTLAFTLTTKIRAIAVVVLLFLAIPMQAVYRYRDGENAKAQAILKAKHDTEVKVAEEKKSRHRDSVKIFIATTREFVNRKKFAIAEARMDSIAKATTDPYEASLISDARFEVLKDKARYFIQKSDYKNALASLDNVLRYEPNNAEFLYQKGICLRKTGQRREAADVLKHAVAQGSTDAALLLKKVNPVKTRVAYYVTRCCDGSTSGAKGRGACSHHGGVCDWNDPVYEEYTDY